MVPQALLCAMLASGCSLIFMDGPPEHPPRDQPVDCTRSVTAPVFDTVFASASGTIAIGEITLLAASNSSQGDRDSGKVGLALFSALALIEGVSAGWGFGRVRECIDLNQEIEIQRRAQKLTAVPPAPPVAPPN